MVGRHVWKAKPRLHRPEPLVHPVQFVMIMHTGGNNCTTRIECGKLLREIQEYQMKNCDLWDIAPNFLIGADGRVYEGRGWDFTGISITRFNLKGVAISFIGNFDMELPTDTQMEAYKYLILEGRKYFRLTKYFRVIPQCLYLNDTRSPGEAFCKEIKTWDNLFIEP